MQLKALHSLVAVRVDETMQRFIDLENHNRSLPVIGTVISVSAKYLETAPLWYVNSVGMEYDVPIEIKEGDHVLFFATQRNTSDWSLSRYEDILFIRYSNLIARVDGDYIYPLNGGLLATQADDSGWLWDVKNQGCFVRQYASFKDEGGDGDLFSNLVILQPEVPMAIEPWNHARFLIDGKRQYLFHRRQIMAYVH